MTEDKPGVEISFTETFPLIVCAGCKARYVLIAVLESGHWLKQVGGHHCPYCGCRREQQKDLTDAA